MSPNKRRDDSESQLEIVTEPWLNTAFKTFFRGELNNNTNEKMHAYRYTYSYLIVAFVERGFEWNVNLIIASGCYIHTVYPRVRSVIKKYGERMYELQVKKSFLHFWNLNRGGRFVVKRFIPPLSIKYKVYWSLLFCVNFTWSGGRLGSVVLHCMYMLHSECTFLSFINILWRY